MQLKGKQGDALGARDGEDELVTLVECQVELRLLGPAGGERRQNGRRVLKRGLRVLVILVLVLLLILLVLKVRVVVRRTEELVRNDDVRQLKNGPTLRVSEVLAELNDPGRTCE